MDVVILLFDQVTALDAVGPIDVFAPLPGVRIRFAASQPGVLRAEDSRLGLVADVALDDIDRADVLLVPGGCGTRAVARDEATLAWIRRLHATTRYTASVCTGALVLGAAGLLRGLPATTHWGYLDRLATYGAIPTDARYVFTEQRIATAAGVSAGIDLALALVGKLVGHEAAQAVQLGLEYDPAPPYDAGSVAKAPAPVVSLVRSQLSP